MILILNITMIVKDIVMQNSIDNFKVIVGLSGGVDSTAAALLLKERGYEPIGLYFNVLGDSCMNCKQRVEEGKKKAEKAAQQLGIRLIYKDLSKEFADTVIKDFSNEYANGRTPNPCIICNPNIKFKVLLDTAKEENAKWIASGHYAGTKYLADTDSWHITRALNEKKDQSYMLYRLNRETISRLILPLNDAMDKKQIRELVKESGIDNSKDKDSQEICFIDDGDDYISFMKRLGISTPKGEFINSEGSVLGEHQGIANYTIGQRKGLGIALGEPAFVTNIDAFSNKIKLGKNEELFKREVHFDGAFFSENLLEHTVTNLCKPIEVRAKIRYAAKPAEAKLLLEDEGSGYAVFDEAQRAATPGQSIVFYIDNLVIGGGYIV